MGYLPILGILGTIFLSQSSRQTGADTLLLREFNKKLKHAGGPVI